MIIMKFGGTSVENAQNIRKTAKIVESRLSKKPIVVVSALGGTTDALIAAANSATRNGSRDKLNEIILRHYNVIEELGLQQGIIEKEVRMLNRLMDGISLLEELTPKSLDKLMSFGERMSARIVAAYMSSIGMAANAYDAYDLGLITESNFGDADVLPKSYQTIKISISKIRAIPVITGFIGKSREGEITTLGRGGSDYTASIIGAAVGAREIQIWTDVNGIMTADPKVVRSARSIAVVSYDEASELAFLGAKVLHPKTILPAIDHNIPVRILNTFNPSHSGTTVLKDINARPRVASITCRKRIKVINISTPKMFQTHGFLRRIFEIFDAHGISVDMVSTSEVNVSLTIDGKNKTDSLAEELGKIAEVDVKNDRAKVSLVGHGIMHMPGMLGSMFTALNGIDVEMISSSISEINQSFVVKEEEADTAVKRLHSTFWHGKLY